MNFRRYYIPGSAVFITQIVQDREPIFHDTENVILLRKIPECLKQRSYEINQVSRILRVLLFVQLSAIESKDKEFDSTSQSFFASRKQRDFLASRAR